MKSEVLIFDRYWSSVLEDQVEVNILMGGSIPSSFLIDTTPNEYNKLDDEVYFFLVSIPFYISALMESLQCLNCGTHSCQHKPLEFNVIATLVCGTDDPLLHLTNHMG